MKNIIEINNFDFSYKDKSIFKNLSLKIHTNTFTTILGLNGSGKTTLVKLILGLLKGELKILFNGVLLTEDSIKYLRKDISVVFENLNQNFVTDTVMDELAFTLENINLKKEDIKTKIDSISEKLDLKNILEIDPYALNAQEKWIVALASALIIEPKLLIIDGGFSNLNPSKKEKVLKVLKQYQKKGMTILTLTSNVEELLYAQEVIILNNGKEAYMGKLKEILAKEELEPLGFGVPFIVELSQKLKFYDLIDDIYLSQEKLVNDLWK